MVQKSHINYQPQLVNAGFQPSTVSPHLHLFRATFGGPGLVTQIHLQAQWAQGDWKEVRLGGFFSWKLGKSNSIITLGPYGKLTYLAMVTLPIFASKHLTKASFSSSSATPQKSHSPRISCTSKPSPKDTLLGSKAKEKRPPMEAPSFRCTARGPNPVPFWDFGCWVFYCKMPRGLSWDFAVS